MIRYYVKKRLFNLLKTGEKKEKYTIALDNMTMLDEEEQAIRMINISTLHPVEFKMAMAFFCEVAKREMDKGRPVQIGSLGFLYPRLRAKSVDTIEEATAENTLTSFSYYFRPSKSLAESFRQQHYRKVYMPNDPLREEKAKNDDGD